MLSSRNKSFLALVQLGIGHSPNLLPDVDDWTTIQDLASKQGLGAVVIDGIEKLPYRLRPPKELLLTWIGESLQNYELRYERYRRTVAEMANFYNSYRYKMMVLKGYACALDWPKPEHRPCGDIDIWLFGKQKEADRALSSWFKERGLRFEIDNSHHHHTVFNWREFTVENHYDFVNVHAHRSSAELEKVFKELGGEANINENDINNTIGNQIQSVYVCGEQVYLPSPNLHALFLIKHMVNHFAAAEITMRHVLDWAFLVEKHHEVVDWGWLLGLLEKFHMKDFLNIINAICVDDLGFRADLFPRVQFLPELKEHVLSDILNPAYSAAEPVGLIPRITYKYRRWQGNAWKQRLCYPESRWVTFLKGIWAKMLKPASF